jgi:NADP-dependent 3-hydroxy acid dehydrogenase YdfG
MPKTLVVAGYGPGISKAVAEKFGAQGFQLALVARNPERLSAAAKDLTHRGVYAEAFPTDLADSVAVQASLGKIHDKFGPVTVLHWNAYGGGAGDLLTAPIAELRALFDLPVTSLVAAVQALLPDLRAQEEAAVLVTNGGLGLFDPAVDAAAVGWGAMGLAVGNSAKHKVVGLLAAKLKPEGVYVGEVIVLNSVKGTAWDNGTATLEPSAIANQFWDLYHARDRTSATIG